MIRAASLADAGAVAAIYNHYVVETIVTFEESPLSAQEMADRIGEIQSAGLPFLVSEEEGRGITGYAHASKWKGRCAYRHSAEITVYLEPRQTGRGVGSALYAALMPLLKERGIHAVIGGIALPNQASVALHEKFGMVKVAHFPEVGRKFDRWIDVGYWQLVI